MLCLLCVSHALQCISAIITVSFLTVFSVVCINVRLRGESGENQRKFRKRGTTNNTIFVVLVPDSGPPFSKVNDIRSHECGPVKGAPMFPV